MDVANLTSAGSLWNIHASFQHSGAESAPWALQQQQIDYDDSTDGDVTDLDVAANRDDEDSLVDEEEEEAYNHSNPYQRPRAPSLDDSFHSYDSYTDREEEEEEFKMEESHENTRLMLASSAAEIHHDFEPRLEFTQRLIRDVVIDAKNKPLTPRESVDEEEQDMEEDDFFPANVPARLSQDESEEEVNKLFDSVQLLSSEYFNDPENLKQDGQGVNGIKKAPSSLSDMIHPMDPKLFKLPAKTYKKRHSDAGSEVSSITGVGGLEDASLAPSVANSNVVTRSPVSVLQMKQYTIKTPKNADAEGDSATPGQENKESSPSRKSSGFKSRERQDDRIAYSLGAGKKGMAPEHRLQSKSYLPKDPLQGLLDKKDPTKAVSPPHKGGNPAEDDDDEEEPAAPLLMPSTYNVRNPSSPTSASAATRERQLVLCPNSKTALSILLVDISQKIFEIVAVDHIMPETSVGDVLSKARVQATDSRLSQQTYVSLCNAVNELAAPMLPVQLIVNVDNEADGENKKVSLKGYDKLEKSQEEQKDPSMGRLLMAVPEGSSAEQVRRIQRALWSHPRMQRWWKKENRFSGQRRHRSSRKSSKSSSKSKQAKNA